MLITNDPLKILGEHSLQHIFNFIDPTIGIFLKRTSTAWNQALRHYKGPKSSVQAQAMEVSKHGYLGLLQILYQDYGNDIWRTEHNANVSMTSSNVAILQFAIENGCPTSSLSCAFAASHGYLDSLKILHENNVEWDNLSCSLAAKGGHLDCLQFLFENGCEWDSVTCAMAAEYGRIDCLKFLHENGCEWDENTTCWAAKGGSLECLKYAHENGCEWKWL